MCCGKRRKSKLFEGKIKARLFIRTGDNWEWTNSDFKILVLLIKLF